MIWPVEITNDLAIIINWARKHLSIKTIGAFGTMSRDILAVIAAGVTSGLPFEEWDHNEKLSALFDKAEVSCWRFGDLFESEVFENK